MTQYIRVNDINIPWFQVYDKIWELKKSDFIEFVKRIYSLLKKDAVYLV